MSTVYVVLGKGCAVKAVETDAMVSFDQSGHGYAKLHGNDYASHVYTQAAAHRIAVRQARGKAQYAERAAENARAVLADALRAAESTVNA